MAHVFPSAASDCETDDGLVPVVRHRRDGFVLAGDVADLLGVDGLVDGVLIVGALADDGLVTEIALRDARGAVDAFLELVAVNAAHDLPAWGYLVSVLLPPGSGPFPAGTVPGPDDLDRIDAVCAHHGVELVDWLLVAGRRGVSMLEVADREWRWLAAPAD